MSGLLGEPNHEPNRTIFEVALVRVAVGAAGIREGLDHFASLGVDHLDGHGVGLLGGAIQVWMFHPKSQAQISIFFSGGPELASANHPR